MHIASLRTSITVSLALLLGLSSLQVHGSDAIDRGWQTAISPVTLNLRNKLADAPYKVTFIVTAIGQNAEWSHTTESEPNAWQRPHFPKDFEGPDVDHRQAQAYTWHARVQGDEGKHLLGGSFTYPNGDFNQQGGALSPQNEGQLIAEFDGLFDKRYKISMLVEPEQQQGGDYISCAAYIRIIDTQTGGSASLLSYQFSLPIDLMRPFVEIVTEPDYAVLVRPGVHRLRLRSADYSHSLSTEGDQILSFSCGFAFADLDHDGEQEMLVACFMGGQRMRTAYLVYELGLTSSWSRFILEPIDDPALRDLDSASTINLAAQTLSNHSSGSAYDSLTHRYKLLPLKSDKPVSSFAERQRYHLTDVTGATTVDVPSGHYREIDRHYRYTPSPEGTWQQQVISIHEQVHTVE